MKKRALILANGRPPTKRLLTKLLNGAFFICADGGANTAARFGLKPDLIIGDLDSIQASTLRKFSRVPARRIADQNSTDLEKALSWVVRKGFHEIVVVGAAGHRLDHSIGNLSALAKFSRKAKIAFIDDNSELVGVGHSYEFEAPAGTIVSLIPLSLCEGIVTKGLKWELRNESLKLGLRESTSNVVKSSPVTILVRRGDLLLYRLTSGTSKHKPG
ncbi:MAG: thiamine diphosphokinase [Ignavibacteriales bacterium]|nr:thiamine diphosphokinase [Ignavibacteriales bacterium]